MSYADVSHGGQTWQNKNRTQYSTNFRDLSAGWKKSAVIPLHQNAEEEKKKKNYWTKHIISWLLAPPEPVIMPIKHILYINNNRQLQWELCQGVLVTHCTEEHTPCPCGIVSLTPAIESFTRGLTLVKQSGSSELKRCLTYRSQLGNLNCARYADTAHLHTTGTGFLGSWLVCLLNDRTKLMLSAGTRK